MKENGDNNPGKRDKHYHDVGKDKCPFSPSFGYTTWETRQEYIRTKNLNDELDSKDREQFESLQANMHISQPLFYWQMYSIWGREPILNICTDFYNLIYNDRDKNNDWFRSVFAHVASKQHHIMAQAAYWVDAMGGGRVYHGGLGRLSFHHGYNANSIMHAEGATLWMNYMKEAIKMNQKHFQQDPRLLPCLVDFLETKMRSYANHHRWEFNSEDFQFQDFVVPPTTDEAITRTTVTTLEQNTKNNNKSLHKLGSIDEENQDEKKGDDEE